MSWFWGTLFRQHFILFAESPVNTILWLNMKYKTYRLTTAPTVQLSFMLCKYPEQIQTHHRGQLLENSTKLNYIAIKMFYIVSTFR